MRILIIKTAALGDVVRTISIAQTLKRVYPLSWISWITSPLAVELLEHHPDIDEVIPFNTKGILYVIAQRYDLLISLDKEPEVAALAMQVSAAEKRGIGLSEYGTVYPLNPECDRYFELGLDDELKFYKNRSSYPQLVHEAVGLSYQREPYRVFCSGDILAGVSSEFSKLRYKYSNCEAFVGLNTGSGSVFANKSLSKEQWAELARRLVKDGYIPLLLGGPAESAKNAWIEEHVCADIINAGTDNSLSRFIAIIDQCDIVVSGDTLGLHLAIGRGRPVVAIFGPTCEQEIDLFGRGRKVISDFDCSPCYKRQCFRQPSCMDAISIDRIMEEIRSLRYEMAVCDS